MLVSQLFSFDDICHVDLLPILPAEWIDIVPL